MVKEDWQSMKLEVMAFECSNTRQWLQAWHGSVSNAACLEENSESKRWQTYQLVKLLMDHHLKTVQLTFVQSLFDGTIGDTWEELK